ncbi:MAG: protein-L-isoaspartate(D-aspartate) O-methyltransferase [Bacteroidales bacterium]|jgi:protein-L-isoaspartate(D-aspartate) O-methyltransferase|nr:protein-L-isoaspartate(D-aspartate) O-methyltransferase [Bacteroidales bacterium]
MITFVERYNLVKEDSFIAKGLRKKMLDQMRGKGIFNDEVLSALGTVPRQYFFDIPNLEMVYLDEAKRIGSDQTISRPSTVAYQTQLLDLKKYDKVLEIGTGSGYQTAILVYLGADVFSIERIKFLYERAKQRLQEHHFPAKIFYGDGYEGLPGHAPFDKILITCAASNIPEKLLKQLKVNGVMVVPVGKILQKMFKITRMSETEFQSEEFGDFSFVPMLKSKE